MITEETLIFYYYGDGLSDAEHEHVRRQLKHDHELNARYELLCEEMGLLADNDHCRAPAGAKAKWQRLLDAEIGPEQKRSSFAWMNHRGFALAAAMSLVFIGGLFVGVRLANDPVLLPDSGHVTASSIETAPGPGSELPAPPRVPVVFVRGVAAHLQATQIQLASMDLDNPAERDVLIEKIVSQNRFFLKVANQNGAHDVARLLRAFEPLLQSLSADNEGGRTAVQIREQLEFEMGITLTKFNRQASNRVNEF